MKWNIVGTHVYDVRRRWNLEVDGEKCNALTYFHSRTVWFDGDLAGQALEEAARHEIGHVWEYHTARPKTDEERQQLGATIDGSFRRIWDECGGVLGIECLPVEGTREQASSTAKIASVPDWQITDRVECGHCREMVMICSSHNSGPQLNDAGLWMIDRWIQCEVCGTVMAWTERSTEKGFPIGQYFNAKLMQGMIAEAFIEEWRQKTRREPALV